jgi:hypothetical protein
MSSENLLLGKAHQEQVKQDGYKILKAGAHQLASQVFTIVL